ncbi:hypothetical protein GYA54_02500 [Candidatus Kuenenbacteria bacterium]|nr:hypothetical protein [Candidatus Kuenenbacteria bacterium]
MHEGKIIMSPRELRDLVIEKRRQSGEDPGDILNDDQPLSYTDVVRLFSLVLGSRPKQEDIVTVRTDNLTRGQVENNIENGILEYLDTYQSGLCTTGLGYHSRSIWKLDADNYILIDPMNENGFEKKNRGQLVDFLANIMLNQPANNNFFFFLREENDEQ